MMNRRGFTLTELLIGTIVMGILGFILARMLVQDSRWVARLEAMMDARQSARMAMNTMAVELRMVSGGLQVPSSRTSVIVNSPYAWGVACDRVGTVTVATLLPADSLMYASASPDGIAARDNATGDYVIFPGGTAAPSAAPAECTTEGIQLLPGSVLVELGGITPAVLPGDVVYLYQRIKYEFAASTTLPGRIGLWRQAGTAPDEELLAPFDTTAGFGFYVAGSDSVWTNPPADLTTVTGLELLLHGESELTPNGADGPQDFDLETRVTFLNVN